MMKISKNRLNQIIQEELEALIEQGYGQQGQQAAQNRNVIQVGTQTTSGGTTVGGDIGIDTSRNPVAGANIRRGSTSARSRVNLRRPGEAQFNVQHQLDRQHAVQANLNTGNQRGNIGVTHRSKNIDAAGQVDFAKGGGSYHQPTGVRGSVMYRPQGDQGLHYGLKGGVRRSSANPDFNVGAQVGGENWDINTGYNTRQGASLGGTQRDIGGSGVGADIKYQQRGQGQGLTGRLSYGPASIQGTYNPATGKTSAGVGFDLAKLEESKLNQIIQEELEQLLKDHDMACD